MCIRDRKQYKAENIVVDPVMVATSGAKLISADAVEDVYKRQSFTLTNGVQILQGAIKLNHA